VAVQGEKRDWLLELRCALQKRKIHGLSTDTLSLRMVRSAQDEKNRQVSLGIAFVAAASAVLIALVLRLGYCCEWFGMHPKLG